MNHFFILGNHPKLSLAELETVLNTKATLVSPNIAVVEENIASLDEIQTRLGGVIKIGNIVANSSEKNIQNEFLNYIETELNTDQKIFFGISSYGTSIPLKQTALELKKALKNKTISSRWVQSKEPTLSSVVVKTNKLLSERGVEFVIVPHKGELLLGITKTVQPFDEFSERDYGRPQSDAKSGMLPPKLARIMINLAGSPEGKTLLDPFCGSGTVLQEAALMGYNHIIGSDISHKAIEDTRKNMDWLKEHKPETQKAHITLFETDMRKLPIKIKAHSVDAIVTEPFLGPPLRGGESTEPIIHELEQLYKESFEIFTELLRKNGKMVIIFPVILKKHLSLEKILPKNFTPDPAFKELYNNKERQSFLYSRVGQKVEREILILTC